MPFMYISLYVLSIHNIGKHPNEEISFQFSQIENCPPYVGNFYTSFYLNSRSLPIKFHLSKM